MAKKIKPSSLESEVNPYISHLLQKARMELTKSSDRVNATLERHIRDYAVPIIIPASPDAANETPSKSRHFYNGNGFKLMFRNGVYGLRLDLSDHKLEMRISIDDLLFLLLPNQYSMFGGNLHLALKGGNTREIIGAYQLKDGLAILKDEVYAKLMETITKRKYHNPCTARLQLIENAAENPPQ